LHFSVAWPTSKLHTPVNALPLAGPNLHLIIICQHKMWFFLNNEGIHWNKIWNSYPRCIVDGELLNASAWKLLSTQILIWSCGTYRREK
jgi:hypothetical protein